MRKLYLITGATGHLGTVLVSELLKRDASIRTLVLPGQADFIPYGVEKCEGDISRKNTLISFFHTEGYDQVTLVHCAAMITIASKENPLVWDVNVNGTDNVMRMAVDAGIDRVIYVSSVHAIPEKPGSEAISEVDRFSPRTVHGQYAKSKAAAAQNVLEYARKGLNVSIVHPSGVIGPGDVQGRNHMIRTIRAFASGKVPVSIQGGYNFVDSRDVVSGILSCEESGRAGECYILSGHYVTITELLNIVRNLRGKRESRVELPYCMVKLLAPIAEGLSLLRGEKAPLLTPYSVYTLHTNGHFSYEKAARAFGYKPRDILETIRDSL